MPGAIETPVRLGFFLGVLLMMALWELFVPRRRLTVRKTPRWASNLGLVGLNALSVRLVMPITAVGAALVAESRGWGLLHLVDWPVWLEMALAVLAFDLAIYLQHVMFHAVPTLWRLHMVHHADKDFDVTTGLRFHTLEILLSALVKLAVVVVVGPNAVAVLVFEVLLNATAMFNHGNVRIPSWIDSLLRWFVVTPDMHRVHHSVLRYETNSNFGFNLPWWDFLLGTYRAQPESGHEQMTIGVIPFREEGQVDRLPGMLLLPFRGNPGPYPINRQDDRSSSGVRRMTSDRAASPDSCSEGLETSAEHSTNPMDELASDYDRWFDSPEGKELFRIELACIQNVVSDFRGRCLEVGVGTGRFASAIGIREGVDPSEPALLLARSRGIDARQGAAERLPYSDGVFEGILLVTTLCFVTDPRVAMREFRRVMKPGGRLAIGMIPADSPWGKLYAEKGRQGHPFYSTAHFHTVRDVISLAENAGFAFLRASSCLLSPPDSPQTKAAEPGIVEDAGFVCLGFAVGPIPDSVASESQAAKQIER